MSDKPFNTGDKDLDELLSLTCTILQERSGMDTAIAWDVALHRLLIRLYPAQISSDQGPDTALQDFESFLRKLEHAEQTHGRLCAGVINQARAIYLNLLKHSGQGDATDAGN